MREKRETKERMHKKQKPRTAKRKIGNMGKERMREGKGNGNHA